MTLDADTVVALDVGGSSLKGAVLDRAGTALWTLQRRTRREAGPDAVVETVLATLEELRAHPAARRARACGLVVPGIVDVASGRAVWSENLKWRDVPFRTLTAERTGLPVALGHDVRAGGLAEARTGAARGAGNVLFVPIGTGIGAAIVVDGRVLDGDGMAGELGHVDVGHREPCACGAVGCLESIASAAAIARRYAHRSGKQTLGASDVLKRMHDGDHIAREVWDEAVDALSRGLATACSLVAPEVIIVGGGLATAGAELIEPLSSRLQARLTFQRQPRIVPAELGERAGCAGAGLLAWTLLDEGVAA
ncbi:ROK family protein [Phytoactinopolyspora endophytica]|uniref:ROK family protein n=1 Tax=Phytoactinopolyspora endophytica TaxID=1642495 RepID=UPI00197C6189|nr:ROK family protein [Phytoactinopolyspora endophytica]